MEWIAIKKKKTFRFVSHIVKISREFDSRKDSHSTKLKQRPQIFRKLSFIELYDSKLSSLNPFDNMVINRWVKIGRKQKGRMLVLETPSNFCDAHWELRDLRNLTPPEIAVETHFHVPHSTKTTSLFSTADAETYWSLLPSSISLLLDGTVQSENTYTYT